MKDAMGLSTVRRILLSSRLSGLPLRRIASAVFAVLVTSVVVISAGCSDQGEGERCDTRATRSGSDDCQAGLSCVPFSDLGGGATTCDGITTCGVCCPDDRTQSTTDVCALSTVLVGADAAAPVTPDAAADSATNVSDAASDASDASDASSALDAANAASDGASDSGG